MTGRSVAAMTIPMLTRDQAGAAVRAAVAERDAIQANLLELDASFGKQLLAGAQLTGVTLRQWDATSATLAGLWQLFSAYSATVDRVAETAARHLGSRELTAVSALLAGPSVQLATGPAPLGGRDLADSGQENLTLGTAVTRMRAAFASVTAVTSAAERVWGEVTGQLDPIAAELARVLPLAAALGDEALATELADAQGQLDRLRGTLNSDPLAWRSGAGADTGAAGRLRGQVAAAAARADELSRLRDGAQARIAAVTAAATTARSARDDAVAAVRRAAAKITAAAVPAEPGDLDSLTARLAGLDPLLASGRWTRLAAELDGLERELAAATATCHQTERAALSALAQRDELRGLLGAYQAKAARLGAAEDPALAGHYERAAGLLWTAPCDLAAAQDAVTAYQRAVLRVQPL
jgi:hypothetical protein